MKLAHIQFERCTMVVVAVIVMFLLPLLLLVVMTMMKTATDMLWRGREMAVGNTFGATALSSYGGFWISYAIIFTPGGFEITSTILEKNGLAALQHSVGFWLFVSV